MLPRIILSVFVGLLSWNASATSLPLNVEEGERIVIIGNGLGERMLYFPHFETDLHRQFPKKALVVRNLSKPGDTPGFRPHPSRETQWAFPSAEKFHPGRQTHLGIGHHPSPDEWLMELKADTIIAFFGYNESFDGLDKVENFHDELDAFVLHSLKQKYNGQSAPQLVLVSPIAFEDLSAEQDLPDGKEENIRLAAYADAVKRVAEARNVGFIDLFNPTKQLYEKEKTPQTINGFALNDEGYRNLSKTLIGSLYGEFKPQEMVSRNAMYAAVKDKNWYWNNDYQILNGVHVYGRRYKPYGNVNYPEEIEKIRQMTELRDGKIHDVALGAAASKSVDDNATRPLTEVKTNYNRPIEFLDVDKAIDQFTLPEGYKIDLFASEAEFPDLRNPVQMTFDNKGRLWVAVIPSYPHYRPGGALPNDKLLIFEDTNNDGRADTQKVFADGLHMPIGFELAPEGVYVATQPNLSLLVDDDGDDRADRMEILVHGFDSHDTHHSISAFLADASGGIYMNEGRFLHSAVETPYGPEYMTDGGLWRFDPKNWKLERFMQVDVSNPWGVAIDDYGQTFLSDASGGANWWSLPLSAKIPHGQEIEKLAQFTTHRVRPTSGTEFVSSRHFPEDTQGDFLINNTIGFLGTKHHSIIEDGAGFTGELKQDLIMSTDSNFRPVDMEFAPDGSLYIVDWHNPLIGHMQHSARDPNRDSDHGRIYRVTYPSRPLVKPVKVAGASINQLLENLKEHEYRTRYRTRREIRGHPANEVIPAVKNWVRGLDKGDSNYGRNLLEALWATWGQNQVDQGILELCLNHEDHKVRSGAVRVLRYTYDKIPNSHDLFMKAAVDMHPRVRLEAIVASSWQNNEEGAEIALEGLKKPVTKWMGRAYEAVFTTLEDDAKVLNESGKLNLAGNHSAKEFLAGNFEFYDRKQGEVRVEQINLSKDDLELYRLGEEVYHRDAHCKTCHAADGKGTIPNIYPPLNANEWVMGEDERLIKIVLKGLWGAIEVAGKTYDPTTGVPPMTGFGGMLNDKEIAGVLTYVRAKFGDKKALAKAIKPGKVATVREATKDRQNFYMVDEILKEHPFPKGVVTGSAAKQWQSYPGKSGSGKSKRIVLISGDEEYRSEEAMSQLGKILSQHHGFDCTVLYAQHPGEPGVIDPNFGNNLPGLEALRTADLMIIATRFRDLPNNQMREIDDYLKLGKPVIGLRTATHAFNIEDKNAKYAHYSFNYNGEKKAWKNGFGEFVLGSTWVSHHGWHKHESTRGILVGNHEIGNGIGKGDIWGPTDVYGVPLPLPGDSKPIVLGEVVAGMGKLHPAVGPGPYDRVPRYGKEEGFHKNDPMMPVAWTKSYQIPGGEKGKVFTTTMGSSNDLEAEGTRRMIVNGVLWAVDIPVPADGANVDLVGDFKASMYGFQTEEGYWQKKDLRVTDFDL